MGLFDFNGNGKTSLGEGWIAYNIYKECTKDDESDDDAYLYDEEEEDDFDVALPIELEVSVNCSNKEKSSAFSVAREEARQVALNDKSIYHYCGVVY